MNIKCPGCNHDIELKMVVTNAPPPKNITPSGAGVGAILDRIDVSAIDGKDLEFVTDMKARFSQYGQRIMVSQKQFDWLMNIADRGF